MNIKKLIRETAQQLPASQKIEHKKDEDPVYSTYPVCDVPVEETHIGKLTVDTEYICPIRFAVATYKDFYNFRLLPAVREGDRLNEAIKEGIAKYNEKAEATNAEIGRALRFRKRMSAGPFESFGTCR